MVSNASEDFPEPERPVKTISRSRGRSSETSWRLCSRAPRITSLPEEAPPPAASTLGRLTVAARPVGSFRRRAGVTVGSLAEANVRSARGLPGPPVGRSRVPAETPLTLPGRRTIGRTRGSAGDEALEDPLHREEARQVVRPHLDRMARQLLEEGDRLDEPEGVQVAGLPQLGGRLDIAGEVWPSLAQERPERFVELLLVHVAELTVPARP